jgi:hypothetical protein
MIHQSVWVRIGIAGFVVSTLTTAAPAAVVQGIAMNGTTGKAAIGNDVVLVQSTGSTAEIGRTKTDSSGRFQFTVGTMQPS